jgi:lysozyme
MIRGIDVSAVQGVIDWPDVAISGIRFAILKCTEGNKTNVDAFFASNLAAARAAGVVVGAYHFAYCLPTDPSKPGRSAVEQAEAAHRLSAGLGELDGDLPPALDLEWPEPDRWAQWGCNSEQIRKWALDAIDAWTNVYGCKPMIYTYPDWWAHVGGASEPTFASCPLWMASYPKDQTAWPLDHDRPMVARPWTDWAVWQFSGGGIKLPNGKSVDGNVIRDEDALHALTHGQHTDVA